MEKCDGLVQKMLLSVRSLTTGPSTVSMLQLRALVMVCVLLGVVLTVLAQLVHVYIRFQMKPGHHATQVDKRSRRLFPG